MWLFQLLKLQYNAPASSDWLNPLPESGNVFLHANPSAIFTYRILSPILRTKNKDERVSAEFVLKELVCKGSYFKQRLDEAGKSAVLTEISSFLKDPELKEFGPALVIAYYRTRGVQEKKTPAERREELLKRMKMAEISGLLRVERYPPQVLEDDYLYKTNPAYRPRSDLYLLIASKNDPNAALSNAVWRMATMLLEKGNGVVIIEIDSDELFTSKTAASELFKKMPGIDPSNCPSVSGSIVAVHGYRSMIYAGYLDPPDPTSPKTLGKAELQPAALAGLFKNRANGLPPVHTLIACHTGEGIENAVEPGYQNFLEAYASSFSGIGFAPNADASSNFFPIFDKNGVYLYPRIERYVEGVSEPDSKVGFISSVISEKNLPQNTLVQVMEMKPQSLILRPKPIAAEQVCTVGYDAATKQPLSTKQILGSQLTTDLGSKVISEEIHHSD